MRAVRVLVLIIILIVLLVSASVGVGRQRQYPAAVFNRQDGKVGLNYTVDVFTGHVYGRISDSRATSLYPPLLIQQYPSPDGQTIAVRECASELGTSRLCRLYIERDERRTAVATDLYTQDAILWSSDSGSMYFSGRSQTDLNRSLLYGYKLETKRLSPISAGSFPVCHNT